MALSADNPFSDLLPKPKKEMPNPFQDLIDQHSTHLMDEGESQKSKLDPNIINRIPHALGEVGSDVLDIVKGIPKAATDVWGAIPEVGEAAKRQVPGAYEQLIDKDPTRAGKNIIGGFAKGAGKIAQIPPGIVDYLAKIGMIEPETAKKFARPTSMKDINAAVKEFVGGEEKPGDALLQGAIPSVVGAGKILSPINPFKLTQGSIVRNVLSKEKLQKGIHEKMYNNLWDKAAKKGIKDVPYTPLASDVGAITKYTPEAKHLALDNYIADRSLANAQKAQSELGQLIRNYNKKDSLTEAEKLAHNAAIKVQKNIKDNMFKDSKGVVNTKLQDRYNKITESYGKNVIPYTKNKSIKEYKRKDITKEQLIDRLSRGPFAAKKGSEHRAIAIRKKLGNKYTPAGIGIGLGAGGLAIINKLLGLEPNKEKST
jgi:hypothetical protein